MIAGVAAAVSVLASGCGGEGGDEDPPREVATGLAPASLNGGTLLLHEDEAANEVFKDPGPHGLVVDGRVFTVRGAGDRLVGTLQISTVDPEVDFADASQRDKVLNGILAGKEIITVGTVEVAQSSTADKTVFVWFGDDMFQVFQLKPSTAVMFEPEDLLGELVAYQTAQPRWRPIEGNDVPDPGEGEEEDPG